MQSIKRALQETSRVGKYAAYVNMGPRFSDGLLCFDHVIITTISPLKLDQKVSGFTGKAT